MGRVQSEARGESGLNFRIIISSHTRRSLNSLRGEIRLRLERAIDRLADNPRVPGSVKMAGEADQWRIRTGDCRVIYAIDDAAREVTILRIGHRRDIYLR